MEVKTLIAIDSSEDIYTICFYDLVRNEFIKSYSFKDLYPVKTILSDNNLLDTKIVFNNENTKLRDLLVECFEPFLLKVENPLNNRVYGVFPSAHIKSYGFDINLVKSNEYCSNIAQYIVLKSKGL